MQNTNIKKLFIRFLPIYGCISTGLIYVSIGVIAILSYLKIKEGGANVGSLFAYLNDFLVGTIFIWIILVGTMCYIAWRFYETITDPYNYGKKFTGLSKRAGIALSSIADALVAYAAISVLFGKSNVPENGQPVALREMVGNVLQGSWGEVLIVGTGIAIVITATVQLFYGITKGYKERLHMAGFIKKGKLMINILAWAGYFSRGIILGIIGFFFIKSGILKNAEYIVNTDKAFDYIGDNIGHFYFILIAVGTFFYGLFMFVQGVTYDTDN